MSVTGQDAWVERVLGLAVPRRAEGAGAKRRTWETAKAVWQLASDRVDRQIGALTARLRADPDPDLQAIAEFGLNALTSGHKVRLTAAIMDCEAAASPAAVRKLQTAIDAFAAHVGSDPMIAVCDRCPDVEVRIAATVTKGLDGLRAGVRVLSDAKEQAA